MDRSQADVPQLDEFPPLPQLGRQNRLGLGRGTGPEGVPAVPDVAE